MNNKALFTALFTLVAIAVWAQPGNPSAPAPIDGGISLLIAAGAGLGAKKVYDAKKK